MILKQNKNFYCDGWREIFSYPPASVILILSELGLRQDDSLIIPVWKTVLLQQQKRKYWIVWIIKAQETVSRTVETMIRIKWRKYLHFIGSSWWSSHWQGFFLCPHVFMFVSERAASGSLASRTTVTWPCRGAAAGVTQWTRPASDGSLRSTTRTLRWTLWFRYDKEEFIHLFLSWCKVPVNTSVRIRATDISFKVFGSFVCFWRSNRVSKHPGKPSLSFPVLEKSWKSPGKWHDLSKRFWHIASCPEVAAV